jgi:hypothetical protein
VGSGVAVFTGKVLTERLQFKLHNHLVEEIRKRAVILNKKELANRI